MAKNGIVIWGTGKTAARVLTSNKYLKPEYFLDNDINKRGSCFNGYEVKHPSDLDIMWKEKAIIVASIYYEQIADQLKNMGLTEKVDFINWTCLYDAFDFATLIDKNLKYISERKSMYYAKSILFMCLTAYDAKEKGLGSFFEEWNKKREKGNLVLGSEATWLDSDTVNDFIALPVIQLPFFMGKGQYAHEDSYYVSNNRFISSGENIVTDEIQTYVDSKEVLQFAAKSLRLKYPDMAKNYEIFLVYYTDIYIRKLFELVQPERIYLWNQFYAIHVLIKDLASEYSIDVRFFEFGNIPGTLQMDEEGQMGESWPTIHQKEFMNLSVNKMELEEARKIWHYLYLSRENRKKQPEKDLWELIKNRILFGRPVVLYAGQNDFESGIRPYTENTRRFHSPIFKSSNEAAEYLAEICLKNHWNFLYKPHPIMCRNECELSYKFSQNVILIKEANINELIDLSDVLVTILSTTAYTSLIRRKATVMLGYTQLKDKGCTYQAFEKKEIEEIMIQALKDGFSRQQQDNFIKHLAQINKYYLYNDLRDKSLQYGMRI